MCSTGCSNDVANHCKDCLVGCECGEQWCSDIKKECSVACCDKIMCDDVIVQLSTSTARGLCVKTRVLEKLAIVVIP
jgi:hypothetical protein